MNSKGKPKTPTVSPSVAMRKLAEESVGKRFVVRKHYAGNFVGTLVAAKFTEADYRIDEYLPAPGETSPALGTTITVRYTEEHVTVQLEGTK